MIESGHNSLILQPIIQNSFAKVKPYTKTTMGDEQSMKFRLSPILLGIYRLNPIDKALLHFYFDLFGFRLFSLRQTDRQHAVIV